jgi:hypothetical protein
MWDYSEQNRTAPHRWTCGRRDAVALSGLRASSYSNNEPIMVSPSSRAFCLSIMRPANKTHGPRSASSSF